MPKNNQSFSDVVKEIVRNIPKGTTMSYGEVAEIAQKPRGARAVARIMSSNYDSTVPCHRVICANGHLGGYNRGGILEKQKILEKEGLTFRQYVRCK